MASLLSYTHLSTARLVNRLSLIACTVFIIAAMALIHSLAPASRPATAEVNIVSPGYHVGLTGTRLTVFTADGQTALLVTDIDVRSLPQADRTALTEGFPLPSDEALSKLLEDYGS